MLPYPTLPLPTFEFKSRSRVHGSSPISSEQASPQGAPPGLTQADATPAHLPLFAHSSPVSASHTPWNPVSSCKLPSCNQTNRVKVKNATSPPHLWGKHLWRQDWVLVRGQRNSSLQGLAQLSSRMPESVSKQCLVSLLHLILIRQGFHYWSTERLDPEPTDIPGSLSVDFPGLWFQPRLPGWRQCWGGESIEDGLNRIRDGSEQGQQTQDTSGFWGCSAAGRNSGPRPKQNS